MKKDQFTKAVQKFKKDLSITGPIKVQLPYTHTDYNKKVMSHHMDKQDRSVIFFADGTYLIKDYPKSFAV